MDQAAVFHMGSWLKQNYDPASTVDENWKRAKDSWDNLNFQDKVFIWSISKQTSQYHPKSPSHMPNTPP